MAQTAEERKIKRLESEVKRLKAQVDGLMSDLRLSQSKIYSEREWRRNFQRLLKDVVQEDTVEEYREW